jgi:NAD(P)H-flavin reductase
VTQALARLRVGDTVGLRGPFGRGWPMQQIAGRSVIIVAGGLGLAPLRPLIYSLLLDQHAATNTRLFYGVKKPAEILFRDDMAQWSKNLAVQTTVDVADASWHGHVGTVISLLTPASVAPDNTIAFVCGPEVMMRFVVRELLKKQLPPAAIYLSMERNMQCATGHCGHCQWGPQFVCKDGPVFCYQDIQDWFHIREL